MPRLSPESAIALNAYLNEWQQVRNLSDPALVELALKIFADLPLGSQREIVLEELCVRADPGWADR